MPHFVQLSILGGERCEEQEKKVCMTIPQQECMEKKLPKCKLVPRKECKMVPEEKVMISHNLTEFVKTSSSSLEVLVDSDMNLFPVSWSLRGQGSGGGLLTKIIILHIISADILRDQVR